MTKVFAGGSRRLTRLPDAVVQRLERITAGRIPVLVGDANGADKAIQRFLSDRHYSHVIVFCSGQQCRNNIGGWPVRSIGPPSQRRGFQFHTAKDRAMSDEATVGLMLWDGASIGTLMNVQRMVAAGKPVVVYVAPRRSVIEVRESSDWRQLLAMLPNALLPEFERKSRDDRAPSLTDRQPALL